MPTVTGTTSARELILDALIKLGVIDQSETIPDNDAQFCLREANRLLDQMNAKEQLIFNVSFDTYVIQTNHQPHTIGPGGDYNVALRPVKMPRASLVMTNTGTPISVPLYLADDEWWSEQALKTLTSTFPTVLYYSPDWPLGRIYLWPIPTQANSLELETWSAFTALADINAAFAYPPGYWDLTVLELAVRLAPSYERESKVPLLLEMRREARAAVEQNNVGSPRISLRDSGLPAGAQKSGGFNWFTGGMGNGR